MTLRLLALICSNELHQLPSGLDPEWANKLYNIVLRAFQLMPTTPPEDFIEAMPKLAALCWGLWDYSPEHERFYREIVARVYDRADVLPRSLNEREKQDVLWAHRELNLAERGDHDAYWELLAAFAPGQSAKDVRRYVLPTEQRRAYKTMTRKRQREEDEEEGVHRKRRRRVDEELTLSSL